jgi:hypothetical protein
MPWESWLVHKPSVASTVNFPNWAGFLAMGIFFALGMSAPIVLFPEWVKEKGLLRYGLIMVHLLVMVAVPIKIILRLGFNVKYVLHLVTPFGSINF